MPARRSSAYRIAKVGSATTTSGSLFVKTIEFRDGATYPDFGCNFETFTNEEMLEVEALGPLVRLEAGQHDRAY